MKKNTIWVVLILILVAILGFNLKDKILKNDSSTDVESEKPQVVTSLYPIYFFASQIAGDKAEVTNVTPSGAEPHDYEPTIQDIVNFEKSDLLILNGGGLELWGDNMKQNLNDKKVIIVTASDGIANKQAEEKGETIQDPHVWLSPQLAKKEVVNILAGFIKADPNNKETYEKNADALKVKLDELDVQYKEGLNNCTQKNIVTSHTAFGYLASTYGFDQVPISGLSPDEEPSARQLIDLAEFAKQNNIKYIFFETLVSPKLSNTLANEIGAQTLVLDPIEGVSEKDIEQGKNYFSIMRDNLNNLRTALECQ